MQQSFEAAESFYHRSENMRSQAKAQFEKFCYPESVSASQESMEFAIKAIFLFLQEEYPRTHELKDEDFLKILEKIPEELKFHNFPRLLLINRFWSNLYLIAKYGNEKLGIGPEKLFKKDEAELALKHADECHSAVYFVRDWAFRKRQQTA